MPRVLIPSNHCDFPRYLAEAYQEVGWDAVVGSGNFDLATAAFDLVHFQWPEELSGWKEPGEARFSEIIARLERWNSRAKLAVTVHNLLPHRSGEAPGYRRLYEAVYQRVSVVGHFTNASREAVLREFPNTAQTRHVVSGYFNLDRLVPAQRDAAASKTCLGIRDEEFVLLVFGGLREWAEIELIQQAFDAANVRHKRLLMCGRYEGGGSSWRQRLGRWQWSRWLRARGAVVDARYIPDAEVHRFIDAADAVVIPRRRALNSGLPALGASFGKTIIAPRCGSYPELLAGTHHPIYEPGDADSLARAIEEASRLDRDVIRQECKRLAPTWSWSGMVEAIVSAAGISSSSSPA